MFDYIGSKLPCQLALWRCRLPTITKIKPKRNRASNSPNPYKALQMRQDIKSEYTETKSDIADKEMKRLNKSQGW